jgi:DNA-binding MarR family transcriptional regulator
MASPSRQGSESDLVDALAQTGFVTTAVLTRIAAEHDVSLTQLRVLAILRDRQVRMSELAAYLGLDRSTISGLVDRAERRGLVRRTPNQHDGRSIDVALTAAGRRVAARGADEVAAALAPLTSALTATEAERLTTLLEKMLTSGWIPMLTPGSAR